MANYRLKLTDRLRNLASQGGLDSTVNNVTSMQRDAWIDIYNDGNHRKIVVADQSEFSDAIHEWHEHDFIYNSCSDGAMLVESFPLVEPMTSPPNACFAGVAEFDATNQLVILTPNIGGSYGAISYYGTLPTAFRVTFEFKYEGSADATYFYWLSDEIPQTESGEIDADNDLWINGYVLSFSEYQQEVKLSYSSGSDADELADQNASTETYIVGEWHTVVIEVDSGVITMSINGDELINFTDNDYGTRPVHNKFGLAARTGGLSAAHFVRNLTIESL